MNRGPFFRFFESPLDPTLVDDPTRLIDFLNSCDQLQRLLGRRDDRGYALLHYAAERNQEESLKCLIVKGADPNIRSSVQSGEITALHIAAGCGHIACLQQLVESGGNPVARDGNNQLPRDHAKRNGQELCLDYLQKQSAEKVQQDTSDIETRLFFVRQKLVDDDMEGLLSDQQFNKLFPEPFIAGHTSQKNPPPVTDPLDRCCDLLNSACLVEVMNRVSRDMPVALHGASLLHAACTVGNFELMRILMDKKPSLLLSTTLEGYTLLHVAVGHRRIEVLPLLVEALQKMNRDNKAMSFSQSGRSRAMTQPETMSFGVPTAVGSYSVLHFAVALDDILILDFLLQNQRTLHISIDASHCGYTPLHLAVHLNHMEATQKLISKGASPNTILRDSNLPAFSPTPLAEATVNRNEKMVKLLVEHGAEDKKHDALKHALRVEDCQSLTPLLLGSLVKCDEQATRQFNARQPRKETRRYKMASINWDNLKLGVLEPACVHESLAQCPFFVQQGLGIPALLSYITGLNVSANALKELPLEFFHLPNLAQLNASNNQISFLPEIQPSIGDNGDQNWPCPALSRLNLSRNLLKEAADFLFRLPNISFLDLSQNKIQSLPFKIWVAPKLVHLNCSNNEITQIPTNYPHILDEFQVETAAVKPVNSPPGSGVTSPRQSRGSRSNRSTGGSSRTSRVMSFDQELETQSSNEADDVVTIDKIRQTRLYDRLNVCNANLTIEWEAEGNWEEMFEGLSRLSLAHNKITDIPVNFPCLCPKLTVLDLSHNLLSKIDIPRAVPMSLRQLNVSHNQIEVLDSYRARVDPLPCTNPKFLETCNGVLYVDPKAFCQHRSHNHLISLILLDASSNQITDVRLYSPIIAASDGPCRPGARIREADVPLFAALASASGKNQEMVRQLARLSCPLLNRLVLSHNEIAEVPLSVCDMSSLNSLDLSHNKIIELRPELGRLGNLWEFPLEGLNLISPPHNIIERGKTKDIIGFLWSLLQKARPYHRMKLMLVGKAGRGKTTLLKRISEKGQRGLQENWGSIRMGLDNRGRRLDQNLSTVGIVVSDWTYTKKLKEGHTQTGLKNITFMTWDFGGQEEYYATHQCFLSRRSLYLVVWNVTDGREGVEELKPWLLNIQARAPNSPVIVVGTHYDKVSGRQRHRELRENVELIDRLYGAGAAQVTRAHGFPTIMRNMVVSGKNGRNINELRDTIFEVACHVRENTVAGRGVGCGRIPEYRLLMDQLVPASYLQLEDSIRNIAINLRLMGKPPVLTYKEFREMVFGDAYTLVRRDQGDRELEQAVQFLHDNGTILHYEDPLLKELYFVDPQWLSDMLAHIVTVREINPFVKEGVMKIDDFSHLFTGDKDFPIRWKREYLRLLTTFEVAVEFKRGKLLIPSHLPIEKPQMPQWVPPEKHMEFLPPLRHSYLLAFIPSGFWARLMSRILSDGSVVKLAQEGCGLTDKERKQLKWVKWRTGMVLLFGNILLLSIEELRGRLFRGLGKKMRIYKEGDRWEEHEMDISNVYGVDISVPDVYPLMMYAQLHRTKHSQQKPPSVRKPSPRPTQKAEPAISKDDSVITDERGKPTADMLSDGRRRVWTVMTNRMSNFADRALGRGDSGRLNTEHPQRRHPTSLEEDKAEKRVKFDREVGTSNEEDDRDLLTGRNLDRALRLDEVDDEFERIKRRRRNPGVAIAMQTRKWKQETENSAPKLNEEANDRMRAGLLSKVIDHINLLVEDWFIGVRPRYLVVPCPHCTQNLPEGPVELKRHFSINPVLRPDDHGSAHRKLQSLSTSRVSSSSGSGRVQARNRARDLFNWITGNEPPEQEQAEVPDITYYAFQHDECIVQARNKDHLICPVHGKLPFEFLAPDTLFLTEGKNILLLPDEVFYDDPLGTGAFATVYKAKIKRSGTADADNLMEVAIKSIARENRDDSYLGDYSGNLQSQLHEPRPLQRSAIISGFNNLKKELAILSPLRHPHIIEFHGISTNPLGLVLELASRGSLRNMLKEYADEGTHLQPATIQAVIVQIAGALKYLHAHQIIYRDLKSDNILVWQFPNPHDKLLRAQPVKTETVYVKLSDYGISQFAATQGARGLVGTPGFIAPEILKYHGKEAYSEKVDIFSYAMTIYELITLHMPFDQLTPNQANQANENGARPTLKKRDLPCPVLIRELMVWCWQQEPDDRPNADMVISTSKADQFLRLADAIRINNFSSQVAGSCFRIIKTTAPKAVILATRPSLIFSPISSIPLPFPRMRHSQGGYKGPSPFAKFQANKPHTVALPLSNTGMELDPNLVQFRKESRGTESGYQSANTGSTSLEIPGDMSSMESVCTMPSMGSPAHSTDSDKKRRAEGRTLSPLPLATVSEEEGKDVTDEHQASVSGGESTVMEQSNEGKNEPATSQPATELPASASMGETDVVEQRKTHEEEPCAKQQSNVTKETSNSEEDGEEHVSPTGSGRQVSKHDASHHQLPEQEDPNGSDDVFSEDQGQQGSPEQPDDISDGERGSEQQGTKPVVEEGSLVDIGVVGGDKLDVADKEKDEAKESEMPTKVTPPGPTIPMLEVAENNPYLTLPKPTTTSLDSGGGVAFNPTDLPVPTVSPTDGPVLVDEPEEEEEVKVFEVWVGSCSSHCSAATVIEYGGSFMNVEDIDLGDSPILCLTMVCDKVWMGFEIGYICVYDTKTRLPVLQSWMHESLAVLSMAYVSSLGRVFAGLANGEILAYSSDIEHLLSDAPLGEQLPVRLEPLARYHDSSQVSACLLPIPRRIKNDDGVVYDLWVGQGGGEITILNTQDLSIVEFLDNPLDETPCPGYSDRIPCLYLTSNAPLNDPIDHTKGNAKKGRPKSGSSLHLEPDTPIVVYSALQHGQYISCWNTETRELVDCRSCLKLVPNWKGEDPPCISALQYSSSLLYVGLTTGEVVIVNSIRFTTLTLLHCHRTHVRNFLPIDLSLLQPSPSPSTTPSLSSSHSSLHTAESNEVDKLGQLQLMSFGTGFRSYCDNPEVLDYSQSAFLLVWEGGLWGNVQLS